MPANISSPKKQKNKQRKFKPWVFELAGVALVLTAVFSAIGIYNLPSPEAAVEKTGIIGTYLLQALTWLCGTPGSFALPFFLLLWAYQMFQEKQWWHSRMWAAVILVAVILTSLSLFSLTAVPPVSGNLSGGGWAGFLLAWVLLKLLGKAGALIVLIIALLSALILWMRKTVKEITSGFLGFLSYRKKTYNQVHPGYSSQTSTLSAPAEPKPLPVSFTYHGSPGISQVDAAPISPDNNHSAPDIPIVTQPSLTMDSKYAATDEQHAYRLPDPELLTSVSQAGNIDKNLIQQNITKLEQTFANFGIAVKINKVSCGPAVTRYEFTPAPGVKVSRIINLSDDLQLSLAAPSIRVEAPIPGKAAIGIEVPNAELSGVGLQSILTSPVFQEISSPLRFGLGEDISGNSVAARLNDMPHLLIAGSTGSGKSVCLNCIIMSILFSATPEEVKLVFIDPKMVELTNYNGLPHLMTPVVTDPKRAAAILKWMTVEMEKRYKLFAESGVRDIYAYQEILPELEEAEPMPFIVIIIDELADLMMISAADVEDSICRLAQMARAAGIHLIVATQRPSVDVVTGIIKANIPSRIAFAVSSQTDSRTILDMGGAEKLLGKGDMLFLPVGANKPHRIQGAFVSDQDIKKVVTFITDQINNTDYNEELEQLDTSETNDSIMADDELFWEAAEVFVTEHKASTSLLQRRLRVGYARAARLVDMLENQGIISAAENNKRQVLISAEQLNSMKEQNIC